MKFLRSHLFVCIAILLAGFILAGSWFLNLDLFDTGIREILRVENNELEEVATAFVLIVVGLAIDQLRERRVARRRAEIEEQRLQVLKATMRTVHDIVNNFLNNMQLFRMEAEEGPLSVESLKLFDDLINETAEKLRALGDSESVVESKMASGSGIAPQSRS